jgi:hypothetical protein
MELKNFLELNERLLKKPELFTRYGVKEIIAHEGLPPDFHGDKFKYYKHNFIVKGFESYGRGGTTESDGKGELEIVGGKGGDLSNKHKETWRSGLYWAWDADTGRLFITGRMGKTDQKWIDRRMGEIFQKIVNLRGVHKTK